MNKYLFVYKLNTKEGKECLYKDLTSKTKFKILFADYMMDRVLQYGHDFETTYDSVVQSVSKNFNEIRPGELYEIVNWYEDQVYEEVSKMDGDRYQKRQQALNRLLKNSGIQLVFEIIHSGAASYAFLKQYSNFSSKYPLDEINDGYDDGRNVKSSDFIRFLDYMILFMCKVNEAGWEGTSIYTFNYAEEYSDSQLKELERIWLAYRDDAALHKLIDDACAETKELWLLHDSDDGDDWLGRIAGETVYGIYHFLTGCLDMKTAIGEEHTNIVML